MPTQRPQIRQAGKGSRDPVKCAAPGKPALHLKTMQRMRASTEHIMDVSLYILGNLKF